MSPPLSPLAVGIAMGRAIADAKLQLASSAKTVRIIVDSIGPIDAVEPARAALASVAVADHLLADIEAIIAEIKAAKYDAVELVKDWMVRDELPSFKGAGYMVTQAHRADMRVIDEAKALAHLSDLNRMSEVMVTRVDATRVAAIARQLEEQDITLEGTARIPNVVWSLRTIGGN